MGQQCTAKSDCADAICHRGICTSKYPEDNGAPCSSNATCKSLNCLASTCTGGKSPKGVACLNKEECESSVCTSGFCAKASVQVDGGLPDAKIPDLDVADQAPPDAPPLDQLIPDAPLPDMLLPDQLIPDAPIPDAPLPDQAIPDAPIPDQATPDAPIPDKLIPDIPLPDQMTPDAPIPDQAVPDMLSPDIGLDSTAWDAGLPTVKDPKGIAITTDTTHPYKWQVAVTYSSGNAHYALVWMQSTISKGYIAGARVDTGGKLLDSTHKTILGVVGAGRPSIASDGTNYLVV